MRHHLQIRSVMRIPARLYFCIMFSSECLIYSTSCSTVTAATLKLLIKSNFLVATYCFKYCQRLLTSLLLLSSLPLLSMDGSLLLFLEPWCFIYVCLNLNDFTRASYSLFSIFQSRDVFIFILYSLTYRMDGL